MKIQACTRIRAIDGSYHDGNFLRVSVPHDWTMLLSISIRSTTTWPHSGPNEFAYGVTPFLEREILDLYSGKMPDIEVGQDWITATSHLAEWLVERQGWSYTNRFKNSILWNDGLEDITDVDSDTVIVKHDRHVAVKSTNAETQTLLSIKWPEHETALSHIGISELAGLDTPQW